MAMDGCWDLSGGCSHPPGLRQLLADEPLGEEVLQALIHAGDAPVLTVLMDHGLHLRASVVISLVISHGWAP